MWIKALVMIGFFSLICSCGSLEVSNGNENKVLSSKNLADDPAVQLVSARTKMVSSANGVFIGKLIGNIELENISYTKAVVVHYTTGNGVWKDAGAYYVQSLPNNRERWAFNFDMGQTTYFGDPRGGYQGASINCMFAVKYVVSGKEYWDNNGGINIDYRVSTEGTGALYGKAAFGKNKVILTYATYSSYPDTYFRGSISTKNLGTAVKAVKVVCTTNNWVTTSVLNASLTSSFMGVDNWFFTDPKGNIGNVTYKFAVSYQYNGTTYWDNNFNNNYYVSIGHDAP